jgi:WD40 repeat protein
VTADAVGVTRVWDADAGGLLFTLEGHSAGTWWCAVSPDGERIVSASEDQTLRVWDSRDGNLVEILAGRPSAVWTCDFNPDGTWLASADAGGVVRVWDCDTWQPTAVLEGHTQTWLTCVATRTDGLLVTGGLRSDTMGSVEVWDTTSARRVLTLDHHAAAARACAVGTDGDWLATGDAHGGLRVWRLPTSERPLVYNGVDAGPKMGTQDANATPVTLHGHTSAIWACLASPDGRWLTTVEAAGTMQTWDTKTWRLVSVIDRIATGTGRSDRTQRAMACHWRCPRRLTHLSHPGADRASEADPVPTTTLPGHHCSIWACAASPDGRWLVTADAVGQVIRWDTATSLPPALHANLVVLAQPGRALLRPDHRQGHPPGRVPQRR